MDESKEDSIWSMASDFYSRKMLPVAIIIWIWAIIFIVGIVYCGVEFYKSDQTKSQIMYAALFYLLLSRDLSDENFRRTGNSQTRHQACNKEAEKAIKATV